MDVAIKNFKNSVFTFRLFQAIFQGFVNVFLNCNFVRPTLLHIAYWAAVALNFDEFLIFLLFIL